MSSAKRFDETGIEIPHTWDELKALEDTLSIYGGATRLKDDQEYYDLFQDVFPREKILELLRRQLGDRDAAVLRNAFPYSRVIQHLPNVKHYLVWSVKGPLSKERVQELLREKFPGKEWIIFETNLENKSVPEMWHVHVMVNVEA